MEMVIIMLYSKDDYYEAKLQLRPYDEELIGYAKKLIDENNNILIAKETEFKYGVDFLTTSQKETQKIARQLKKRFKGTVTLSRKLFGTHKQTSKMVWRVTVCFRKD
jgi:NMD protein affecting ribosome stability and mRNA decay